MTTINVYAPITKSERGDDGNLYVYGKMTGPDLDLDGQRMDPAWLQTAVPEWFNTGANLRLMHQAIAVGKGTELEQQGDDWWLTAKVVDPAAQKLVDEGVLAGFSIGIKAPKLRKDASAPNGIICGGQIVENSLVDRPCNETAKLVLAKMVGADLVEVEELTKDANAVDDAGAGDLPADDVDHLQVARDALAAWLASEAAEVAAGTGGVAVVQAISSLLQDLSWAATLDSWDDESAEAAMKSALTTPKEADVPFSLPDLAKAVTAEDPTDDDTAAVADVRKGLGIDAIEEKLATALTKAAAAEERADAFAVELAEVKKTATTSGPVRVTPQHDAATTAANDRLTKAAHFRDLASHVTDRNQAAAYRAMADQLDPPTI